MDLYIQGDNKWRYADTEEKEEEVCVWRIHVTWLQTRETSIDLIVPAKVLSSWFVKIRTIPIFKIPIFILIDRRN